MKRSMVVVLSAVAFLFAVNFAEAGVEPNKEMAALIDSYLNAARRSEPGFKGFSADAGKAFFNSKRIHSVTKEERGCIVCHTADPTQQGKTTVGKVIEPMAASVNKERFTDPQKVEKWFKRNCNWTLERECTPQEKGNYIMYMLSI